MFGSNLGNLWPLGSNTKEKRPADIGFQTRDPKFTCPNASHCTTISQRRGFPDPSLRLSELPFIIHREYSGSFVAAPTTGVIIIIMIVIIIKILIKILIIIAIIIIIIIIITSIPPPPVMTIRFR